MKTNDSHVHSNIQGKMKREIVKQRKRWKETPRIERHKLRAQLRNEINNFNAHCIILVPLVTLIKL